MTPKRIGFVGFDGVTASHLVGPADTFSAAALDDGYSNRISCYQIHVIGLSPECCRAESGMIFTPEETFEAISEWDTIVVPGGKGLRKPEVCERIADWVLMHANRTRRMNGTTISAGMQNVTDEDPPFVAGSFENGCDESLATIKGRFWYVGIKKRF